MSLAHVCREKILDASAVSLEIEQAMPLTSQGLVRVAEVYGGREKYPMSQLPDVLPELNDELSLHMRKEEMVLFPTIEAYEAAAGPGMPLPPTARLHRKPRAVELERERGRSAQARL